MTDNVTLGDPMIIPGAANATFLEAQLYLDDSLTLDAAERWYLDQRFMWDSTSHIAVQLAANQIQTDGEGTEYLMQREYLDYVLNAVNATRKVTDIPHVMVQLTATTDTSGDVENDAKVGTEFSIPSLKLQALTIAGFTYGTSVFTQMAVGSGSVDLYDEGAHFCRLLTWLTGSR